MKLVIRSLIIGLLVLFSGQVFAQGGKITGIVKDAESGETLIGANVIIQGSLMGAASDFDGRYTILNVPPGSYTIEAKYLGFATVVLEEVVVRSNLTTQQDFTLIPQSFEGEEIVVTATQPVILKDVTSSEQRVSAAEIQKLPVQELNDVVKLQAGVNVDDGGGIHIRGGRSTEVSYIVDGIRVTDDFNRSQGLRVENQSIQELQIISGTFNAEYGQAMSGIINIVSKSGSNEFHANVNVMGGGYLVKDGDRWRDVSNTASEFDPVMQQQIAGSIEGPIIKNKLTFFTSFRYFEDEGYQKGRNFYSPQGAWSEDLPLGSDLTSFRDIWNRPFDSTLPWNNLDTLTVGGQQILRLSDNGTRDSSIVDLGTAETYNLQANVQFVANKKLKFNLIGSYGFEEFLGYNHGLRLMATAIAPFERENFLGNLKTTFTPTSKTFVTANVAFTRNRETNRLFDDPFDPRHFGRGILPSPGQFQFNRVGTSNFRSFRETDSWKAKVEISSQMNAQHFVKAGVSIQADHVDFNEVSLQEVTDANLLDEFNIPEDQRRFIQTFIPNINTRQNNVFEVNPLTLGAFVQDKMEFENFIVNVGLRLDFFDPNAVVPADARDPDINRPLLDTNRWNDTNGDGVIAGEERSDANLTTRQQREAFWWDDASVKFQLSPRLGIAYPLTNGGVINFSYGWFFQVPTYQQLYANSQIELSETSGLQNGFGNPDLDPERTVQYELGYKQEIFEGTALEVTGFFRDSRDYVANQGIQATHNASLFYNKNINLDFQRTLGFTAAISQRIGRKFNFSIDYTYTKVEGSTTDFDALNANAVGLGNITGRAQQDVFSFTILQPWDRTHILNSQWFYNEKTWGVNLTTQFQSGQPFTPSFPFGVRSGLLAAQQPIFNRDRRPSSLVTNVNAYKNFNVLGQTLGLSVTVFNLLDSEIITNVFSDSGEPDRPILISGQVDPTFLDSPSNYGQPRRIQISLNYSF